MAHDDGVRAAAGGDPVPPAVSSERGLAVGDAMTFERMLFFAGLFHFALLPVSLSVPRVLKWKTDLAGVSPLSRQIIWGHGVYIVGTVLAFGVLTLIGRQ